MKNLMITIITITTLLLACDKNKEPYLTPIPQKVIDYFAPENAKDGSYYVFQEQNTNAIDTLWLTDYEIIRQFIICGEDTTPQTFQYKFKSNTTDNLDYRMELTTNCTGTQTSITLHYGIGNFGFKYNAIGDTFSSNGWPLGEYFQEYNLDNLTFNDVYLFDQPGATSLSKDYVWAKDIGLIRIFVGENGNPYNGQEDWHLIDYNLKN